MAYQISNGAGVPHATDYADLLAKLVTFATANGWTLVENSADKVVLKGSGTTGTDAIYVAFQLYADTTNDAHGWYLNGYTGYAGTGVGFTQQPGAMAIHMPCLPLANSAIPYWFIVSPRLIKVVAKVSTTYQACYLGYPLAFATPGQYPYPLVIGGSNVAGSPYTSRKPRWSDTSLGATCFANPLTGLAGANYNTPLYVRLPSGVWKNIRNAQSGGQIALATQMSGVSSYHTNNQSLALLRPALDGTYSLQPLYVCATDPASPNGDILGEFDGVRHITGYANGAENTVTIGADTWLVVQNAGRTGTLDYFAVKLA